MDENFAYWSALFKRAGKWFSSSLALGTNDVADITDRLFSGMPCYHNRARCLCPSLFYPTWWAHNPRFHRIETWLSWTPLFPKLFLTPGFVGNSRTTSLQIYFSIWCIVTSVALDPFHTRLQSSNGCLLARNFPWNLITLLSIFS